jgi:hypothetical protein
MCYATVNGADKENLNTAFSLYLELLSNQTKSGGGAGAKFTVDLVDEETLTIETDKGKAISLGPVPYRPGDKSTTVEIYIQFQMTVRKDVSGGESKYLIVKSSTEMVYLEIVEKDGEEARERTQGLHFDFDLNAEQANGEGGKQDANHPLFHAQYNPNCVDTEALDRWNPDQHERSYPEFPRIPCPPFDIVSVGYMIMNDHLPEEVVGNQGWPTEEMLHENLPRFPEEAFRHTRPNQTMVAESWYNHHCTDDDGTPLLDVNRHRPV